MTPSEIRYEESYHDPQSAGHNRTGHTCLDGRIRPGGDHSGACAGRPGTDGAGSRAAVRAKADGHLATAIIGETVYNGTGEDAQNIGDVNDIVIGKDGNIEAIVVGVGGFLGIGEKDVAVEYAELDWAERDGDRWLVAPMTKEQLESQAAFDRSAYEPAPAGSRDRSWNGASRPGYAANGGGADRACGSCR